MDILLVTAGLVISNLIGWHFVICQQAKLSSIKIPE
jgi:hypothetical protein